MFDYAVLSSQHCVQFCPSSKEPLLLPLEAVKSFLPTRSEVNRHCGSSGWVPTRHPDTTPLPVPGRLTTP